MNYVLKEKPVSPIIIQGFPSFGLVSTIATGFLIDHLDAKPIGEIVLEDNPPMLAIHNKKLIRPVEIYYAKKENLVIINALANIAGKEWDLSETVIKLSKELKSKEILILEGIVSQEVVKDPKSYYFSTKDNLKFKKMGLNELNEGVIVGMSASIISKAERLTQVSCIFTETHPNLPDNKAAAKIIEVVDNYLNLKIDYKPLLKKAQEMEEKLKGILTNTKNSLEMKKNSDINYLG